MNTEVKERTMRGKKAHLAKGNLPQGTGIGIYGYSWNTQTKKREVNQFEANVVDDIFQRVASGESLVSIARTLNQHNIPTKANKVWHSLTLRRMVKNTCYIGQTRFKEFILPDVTPPIIDDKLFQNANNQINKPKPRTGIPKNKYLLRHHIFCAICGKPLVGHCLNKKYRYYQCSDARPYENNKKKCLARYVRAGELETTVWEKTREVLVNPEIILNQLTKTSDSQNIDVIDVEISTLKKRMQSYRKRHTNLLQALEWGEFEKNEILDRLNRIKNERQEDEEKLNDLQKTRNNLKSLSDAQVKFDELYNHILVNLQNSTSETIELALDALDIKVYASTDKVEIQGVIPLEQALPPIEQTSG